MKIKMNSVIKVLEAVQKQLHDLLKAQKIDILNMEFAKKLEDETAVGSSLVEIAEKI